MEALPTEPILAYHDFYESPIGWLRITSTDYELTSAQFCNEKNSATISNTILLNTSKQLDAYFKGSLKNFDLPLKPVGTPFQQKVWNQLQLINFGETISYQKQAIALGDKKVIRAMASANGKNPIAIVIPCHRVIGTNGSLTGYAGELWRKDWLLEHEAKISGKWNKLF